jgi:hypothetical protein
MNRQSPRVRVVVALVAVVLVAIGAYFIFNSRTNGGSATSPVHVRLEPLQLASAGETMTFRATVMTTSDMPNTEIYSNTEVFFDLSSGITVVGGQLRHQIHLEEDVPQSFELQIQIAEPGEYRVLAVANSYDEYRNSFGGSDRFYLEVGTTGTQVRKDSLTPEPTSEGLEIITLDEMETRESSLQATNEAEEQVQTPEPTADRE